MKLLEKSHQEVSNDREAISTLLALSKVQLETSLQANKVLETRVQYAASRSTGSTGREVELEQQLALSKALVDAQRLESYNMFSELQGLKAELAALKQSVLQQPMLTQQSLHASKAASTSSPKKGPSDLPPSTFSDLPTEPDYEELPTPTPSEGLLLTRRPGDNKGIEYRRKQMNERQAKHERRCYEALSTLWPEPYEVTSKIWPSIMIMKAQLAAHFQQWHEDNPTDELKPGYQEIDVDKW